jgi:hypothetical protein
MLTYCGILRAEEECIVIKEFIKKINWATAELDVLRKDRYNGTVQGYL